MSNISREDVERIFQQKFAELNQIQITGKQEFGAVVDTCFKYFIDTGKAPKPYSYILQLIDLISEGVIRSALSRGIGTVFGLAITFDTRQATCAAMESVLKWLDITNEQDPDKIGYIIDQYIRYWTFYFAENYHTEDPSALKQFEPDLEFRYYKK
jgi:hypothetical protein